jgi:predicted ArsR family transcriptional regulator
MPSEKIIQYLTKCGEQLDSEIAHAIGLPLSVAQHHLSALTAQGKVMSCHITKFVDGHKSEGITCRIVGYIPKVAPGKKTM